MKQPLIPPPPKPPAEKLTIGNLATITVCHMIILIGLFLAVIQPEFFKYKMVLFSITATFEAFFGLTFLHCIPSSNEYSAVEFTGLFIINGIIANLMIYFINLNHLFWGTTIWWIFCLVIVAGNICKVKVKPPQNTTPVSTVTVTVSPAKLP
jgi:hypothetical protein